MHKTHLFLVQTYVALIFVTILIAKLDLKTLINFEYQQLQTLINLEYQQLQWPSLTENANCNHLNKLIIVQIIFPLTSVQIT
jgi:hypothetical protein